VAIYQNFGWLLLRNSRLLEFARDLRHISHSFLSSATLSARQHWQKQKVGVPAKQSTGTPTFLQN
jgi:hypothetical protein